MAGVYISYPICRQKCTFCNFASGVFPADFAGRYVAALREEIAHYVWQWRPETLYLGGGTPGDLEENALSGLLQAIPGAPWVEATIESAPGSLTPARAESWVACGINRVSLGVQSFVERELARTGRRHNAQTVAREAGVLRAAGITNFNIDLIAGLPSQTPSSWNESLDWIARLEAPHVSIYMLEVDDDSRLGREILAGGHRYGAQDAPLEEVVVELYEAAVERLDRMGVQRYEISNFARPGLESRHNLKYWRREPYVGFGADAHSFDGATRRANVESPAGYVERMEQGRSAESRAGAANAREEKLFVGLRLSEGVRLDAAELERYQPQLRRFTSDGLLSLDGNTLRLTARGILFSNEVLREFIGL
jgi:oxygen-independent coproporphyrinogen-3 oxidase